MDPKKHRWLTVAFAGLIAFYVFLALTGHIRIEHPILQ